jgi:hypothetical protein
MESETKSKSKEAAMYHIWHQMFQLEHEHMLLSR